ncbi:uncharacterized protein LOC135690843 isoform X3 [Rhopilema esculentum]|uniref:uncharacterized protein LOC135690843 isoform X3 n=1 Tax=Rhopilema esculentum TaxID=499914 RepID=UPI0031D75B40
MVLERITMPASKRNKGNVKRTVYRRGTQSLSSMAARKVPIVPVKYSFEGQNTTARKISVAPKKARRRSEPFLFTSAGRLRKTSAVCPPRQFQAVSYKRRLSTTNALLPSANKIRLQELANTELLASLNEPFGKDESEQELSDDEKEETDFAISEPENELRKLTELKRVKVIEEIFETERKYISCLDTVDKVFKVPMLDGGIAQEKDVNALFPSCLSTIKECHSWFMEQLENRMKSDDWSGGIGDILGKMAGPLKENLLNVYTDYVNAFPKSISTFSKCTRASHKFRKFIEDCYCRSDNLDLPSYLITPVQRLPRYVLLLRQLSKYTNEDHPDNGSIKTALLQMEELITSLNSSIHNSMQAYTARESEARKTIRRQLSRRRKKPRPVSLNLKDLKTDEKNPKATSPEQHNKANRRNSIAEPIHLQTVPEQTNGDEQDAKEYLRSRSHGNNSRLSSPSNEEAGNVVMRKNKTDNRKSFRRSLGAALSSLWSPREDKEHKSANDNPIQCTENDIQVDANANGNLPLRRKVGVAYPSSATVLDSEVMDTTQSIKSDDEVVKKRRFSGSFRERTRSFKIQVRRRSGTWFSTSALKNSDLNLTGNDGSSSHTPSITVSDEHSLDDGSPRTPRRNTKSRSSFMSLFSKRKLKSNDNDSSKPERRRSECHTKTENSELAYNRMSTSISAPLIAAQRKESMVSKVNEVISEEGLESAVDIKYEEEDATTKEQSVDDENLQANGSIQTQETAVNNSSEKKHKKGKLMKTLRNIIGKGKG